MKSKIIGTFAALALAAVSANAAILVTPTGIAYVTDPSQQINLAALNNPTNLINGEGLSAAPTINNYATLTHRAWTSGAANSWATTDPGGFPSSFFASGGLPQIFIIDLGGTFPLTDFVIWGYHNNDTQNNNASTITLEFSTDGGTTYGGLQTVNTTPAIRSGGPAQTLSLTPVDADFVRLTVTDNFHGEAGGIGGDRVGLAEFRFIAIPEPTTALLGAFGLLAFLRRRR